MEKKGWERVEAAKVAVARGEEWVEGRLVVERTAAAQEAIKEVSVTLESNRAQKGGEAAAGHWAAGHQGKVGEAAEHLVA